MKSYPSPSEQEIFEIVQDIVQKYVDMNDGEALPMLEVLFHDDHRVEYKMPDWLAEISDVFDARYGNEKGAEVLRKVVSQYIIGEDVLH